MASGIYAILNLINSKYYIGSAVDFDERFRLHLLELNRNNHHNRHLQKAWNKHGQANFKFVILEECNADILLEREQFAIRGMDATNRHKGYNICAVSWNRLGVKASDETREKLRISHTGHKHSDETKKKMGLAHKGNTHNKGRKQTQEHKDAISNGLKGRIHSPETVAKIAASNRGRKASPEAKLRMSIAAKNRRQKERAEANKSLDYTCDMWV